MKYYENRPHGTHEFPVGIHDTYCANGFSLHPHLHREFEFLIITKGGGTVFIDDNQYEIKENNALFIGSQQLHIGTSTDNKTCEFFAVVFSPEIFGSHGDDLIVSKYVLPVLNKKISFNRFFNSDIPWQKNVMDMLKKIHEENIAKDIGYELKIKTLLMEIWRLCFVNGEKQNNSDTDKTLENIKKVFEYIHREYASPVTLDDIASYVNMSKGYFCRRFSDIMHMTPFEYLLCVRIENSCRMLTENTLSIGEISQECGFNSFSYFSKTFKKIIGCTPREYIKQQKTLH